MTVSSRARLGGAAGGAAAVIGRAQLWDGLRILSKRREFSKRLYALNLLHDDHQRSGGDSRARSHCRFVPPLIHFIPELIN